MLIERQLEDDFITTLKSMPELSASQVVGSREVAADGETKTEDDSHATIVAVACGFRQNDAFSLSPITMSMSIAVMTRTELDPTSEGHSRVIEAVADLLSHWHKDGTAMTEALSNEKFFAGELRMDGGTARTYDSQTQTWSETINFSIRGAERFMKPTTPTVVTYVGGTTKEFDIEGEIGYNDIDNIVNAVSINIGSGVTSISDQFASSCLDLEEVTIPNTVTAIGDGAFANTISMTTIVIPSSVQSIGDGAFYASRNMEEVTFEGKTVAQVQAMANYSWRIVSGCVLHCTDGDITI